MRTTATYDKEAEQFVLHTPDFEAAKCWAGGKILVFNSNLQLHPVKERIKILILNPNITIFLQILITCI